VLRLCANHWRSSSLPLSFWGSRNFSVAFGEQCKTTTTYATGPFTCPLRRVFPRLSSTADSSSARDEVERFEWAGQPTLPTAGARDEVERFEWAGQPTLPTAGARDLSGLNLHYDLFNLFNTVIGSWEKHDCPCFVHGCIDCCGRAL
jgi:hypothetical protein